jgi:hypothetical protein
MARKKRVYLAAAISAIMLYSVGIFTGAVILKYTEDKSSAEFAKLHEEIQTYGDDLGSIELELLYLASGESEMGCRFIQASLNRVQNDLSFFWSTLPQKLEVYETENQPSDEYNQLKGEYMEISLKAWLLSLSVRERCGTGALPILYFYSRDCPECIEQGEALDKARETGDIMVYTIDLNLESDSVSMVREAYSIEKAPALIIEQDVYREPVKYQEIIDAAAQKASYSKPGE